MTKTIGFILLSILSTLSFATTAKINVESYIQTDMDFIFEVKNQNFKSVFVDCQGFINNLRVEDNLENKNMVSISNGECEYIHTQIMTSLSESNSACLKIDFERQAFGVTKKCD